MLKDNFDRCEEIFGKTGREVLEKVHPHSPRITNLVHDYFANNLYKDETLSIQTRELVVIAIIAAQGGLAKPLEVHIQSALNQGVSKNEIIAVLEMVASYAGMPKAISAIMGNLEIFSSKIFARD